MRLRRWAGPVPAAAVAVLVAAVLVAAGCGGDSEPGGSSASPGGADAGAGDAAAGEELASSLGCGGCHSSDGTQMSGPTWAGRWADDVTLSDGSTVTFDEDYVARSLSDPAAQVAEGYNPVMSPYDLSDAELADLTAYIRSLG